MPSEDEVQGNLNLASAADGLVHVAQTSGAVVAARVRASAGCGQRRRTDRGEAVVILVLRNVVDGHVEAGRVSDVENVKAELQVHPLGDAGVLHKRNVHPPLPGLAKNIALPGGEVRFVRIVGRNGATQSAGGQQRNGEASGIERGKTGSCTAVSGYGVLWGASRSEGHDRVGNAVRNAVEDAADRAAIVDHTEGLAALINGERFDGPAIGEPALDRSRV